MRRAIVSLLTNSERYVITVRQAPVNRDTGDPQESGLVLFEKDPLDLTNHLDVRLLRARAVKILLVDKSRRVISIEFPQRSWRVLADGTDLRNRLTEFNDHLVIGAKSRMFTSSTARWLISGPVYLWIIVIVAWGASVANPHPGKAVPNPRWLNDFSSAIWYGVIPISWVTALFVFIVISNSGALGVWPKRFTRRSLSEGTYQVRATLFTPASIAALIIATIAGVIGAVVGVFIAH